MTDLIPGLRATIDAWRKRAKTDARYGVSQSMKSDREYYGTVNAALAVQELANELEALLSAHEAPRGIEQISRATLERQLDYLRRAMCDILHLTPDAPDEDIIDIAAGRLAAHEAATPWRVEVEAEEGCFAVDVWRGDEAFRLNVFDEFREADSYRQIVTETFSHSKLAHEAATPAATDTIEVPAGYGGEPWCSCGHRLGKHKARWMKSCCDPNCACSGFVDALAEASAEAAPVERPKQKGAMNDGQ